MRDLTTSIILYVNTTEKNYHLNETFHSIFPRELIAKINGNEIRYWL